MTKRLTNLWMTGLILLLTGCAASKRVDPSYDEQVIKGTRNMGVVAPVLELWKLENQGPMEAGDYDSLMRFRVRARLAGFVQRTQSTYHEWESVAPAARDSLQAFFDSVMITPDPHDIPVPDAVLSAGAASNLLFIRVVGAYKTKERKRKEFWKALGIGVGTLGMFIPVYYPGSCRVQTILVDREKRRIVYVDNVGIEDDFRKEKVLNKLLDKSIDKYYGPEKEG